MPLDPYSPCPAGTGKKLKFCCSDLTGELEKIQRMIAGDQRLACLEYIEQLQSRFPDRACLLTTQAQLLLELGRVDDAKRAAERVLAHSSLNPVALAELALVTLGEGDIRTAIARLQLAVANSPSPVPATVVDAVQTTAESLVAVGQIQSALGHLLLAASLAPQDERTLGLIVRLNASPQVPLPFKEEPDLRAAPAGAAWEQPFNEALESARRGAWQVAVDKFTELAGTAAQSPELWHNLGVLRGWLADERGANAAWRQFAALADVDLDDRVEAEALAQLLDVDAPDEQIDLVAIEYPLTDSEALAEKFTDRRLATMSINPAIYTERDEVPPRSAFALLDRPAPREGAGMQRDQVPNILGQVLLFGRQTDREARLELSAARPNLAGAQALLQEIAGASLGPAGAENVHGGIPVNQWALSWNWRLPEETPIDDVHRLLVEQRRFSILQRWTQTPLAVLNGRTPQQSAPDQQMRIKLLGAILILELSFQEPSVGDVFAELRRRLELPAARPLEPTPAAAEHVPLARLHRVEWEKADDDTLLSANRRAMFAAAPLALRKTALAILGRESLRERVNRAQVYGLLARLEDDTSQAITYLDEARTAAEAAGQSTAMWDLQELTLRLERGEPQEFQRLLVHIQQHHAREPGVAQALMQILVEAGVVTPDGRPTRQAEAASPLVVPGAGATEPGKIWTPESESGAGTGKKSGLWVPGSE